MEFCKTSTTNYFSVVTDDDREITVIEMYDDNSDSTCYEMLDINTDNNINEDEKLFNEIVSLISE